MARVDFTLVADTDGGDGLGESRDFANHLLDQFICDRHKKMARPHMCMLIFSSSFLILIWMSGFVSYFPILWSASTEIQHLDTFQDRR